MRLIIAEKPELGRAIADALFTHPVSSRPFERSFEVAVLAYFIRRFDMTLDRKSVV